jgi:hypothetical protein
MSLFHHQINFKDAQASAIPDNIGALEWLRHTLEKINTTIFNDVRKLYP